MLYLNELNIFVVNELSCFGRKIDLILNIRTSIFYLMFVKKENLFLIFVFNWIENFRNLNFEFSLEEVNLNYLFFYLCIFYVKEKEMDLYFLLLIYSICIFLCITDYCCSISALPVQYSSNFNKKTDVTNRSFIHRGYYGAKTVTKREDPTPAALMRLSPAANPLAALSTTVDVTTKTDGSPQ